MQARTAYSLLDSIGVAVHLDYLGTSYGRFADVIEPRLVELGVRHIRDGLNLTGAGEINQETRDKFNRLAELGIRSTLVMDPRSQRDPATAVEIAKSVIDSIVMVEGANELDHGNNRGVSYKGQTYPGNLRQWQSDLYAAFKADPAVRHLPVTTGASAGPESYSAIQYDPASYDAVAFHYYVNDNKPIWGVDEYVLPKVREGTAAGKALVCTETGWSNAAISQELEAKYVPRMYLEHFDRGIQRSFLYEFAKETAGTSHEEEWGILNFDGSPQPAFNSLKNALALLKDEGGGFTPGKLDYTLDSDSPALRQTLLQRSDGSFSLVLWQDTDGRAPVGPVNTTLTLPVPFNTITTYLPLESTAATSTATNASSVPLSIPDHLLIVDLR